MRSCDYEMWEVVMDGPYVPTKTKEGSEELEPKLKSEWTDMDMKKVQLNFKAMNTLHCALNPTEFNRISTCKSAKEIWDKLEIIAIQEAKNPNEISLGKICGSCLTHEQEVNQIYEEEKMEVVEMKKEATMTTWSNSDSSSSDEELEIKAKANLCLMAIDSEVCDDELDDLDNFDDLQNEYEGLLKDYEKLLHKCTKYRKTIFALTHDLEKAKHVYDEVSKNNIECQSELNNARTEIETLKLELENKDKALNECMNENIALKLSNNENLKHCDHDCLKHDNRQYKKKHAPITCYNCGRKGHITYYCSFNKNVSSTMRKIWVPKGSHVMTNHQGPIKVWVPKSST